MPAVGIVCEYNPFHEGHKYQIERARELTGADTVVAVMNGDFVQRGAPAIADKYTRAEMALLGGADLVFELPVRYGVSSAEDFAYGGILALESLSFVDFYCFGSESGDLSALWRAGRFFAEEDGGYRARLADALREGISYPAARERAFRETRVHRGEVGSDDLAECDLDGGLLSGSNNILGIEYIKAAEQLHSHMEPVTVLRRGMGYNDGAGCVGEREDGFLSATAIRENIRMGDFSGIPRVAAEVLRRSGRLLDGEDFWPACSYAIRRQWEELERVKDISPGLANRFRECWYDAISLADFVNRCKAKNVAMSRIRRCIFQALLGVEKVAERERRLPYIRLLGMRRSAAGCLGRVGDTVVLGRLAGDRRRLGEEALRKLDQDILAADLYRSTAMAVGGRRAPDEFKRRLIVV